MMKFARLLVLTSFVFVLGATTTSAQPPKKAPPPPTEKGKDKDKVGMPKIVPPTGGLLELHPDFNELKEQLDDSKGGPGKAAGKLYIHTRRTFSVIVPRDTWPASWAKKVGEMAKAKGQDEAMVEAIIISTSKAKGAPDHLALIFADSAAPDADVKATGDTLKGTPPELEAALKELVNQFLYQAPIRELLDEYKKGKKKAAP
jgi:hypothetical protein